MSENDPPSPLSLISGITKVAQLEKERDEIRREKVMLEMKLGVAETKLNDLEECLAPLIPPKVGETLADRVKQLAAQLDDLSTKVAALTDMRRSQEERRARWEHIADLVSGNVDLGAGDVAATASAAAVYCDQLVAEGDKRFGDLSPVNEA